jgi:hypothetical protein
VPRSIGHRSHLFGPILHGRADEDLALSALTAVLGADTWDALREQGLSAGAAREVLVHTVTRLLEKPR